MLGASICTSNVLGVLVAGAREVSSHLLGGCEMIANQFVDDSKHCIVPVAQDMYSFQRTKFLLLCKMCMHMIQVQNASSENRRGKS